MLSKVTNNLDAKIIVSSVVSAFVVGGIVLGLNKVGLKQVAKIAKGGN